MLITVNYQGKCFTKIDPHSEEGIQLIKKYAIPQDVIDLAIQIQNKLVIYQKRRDAYLLETDPLYMEWQYDQSSEKEQAWRDKVAEIKIRYPLPTAQ